MIDQIRLDFVNNSPEIKKELEQLLLRYKTILSKSLYEYLKSLLNCEFSAIASIISDEEKETLCDLFIYRTISMYNIYNRTLNLLNSNFNLDFKKNGFGALMSFIDVSVQNKHIPILKLYHGVNDYIGNINLFLTKWSPEIREQEFARLFAEYEQLSKEKLPYTHKNNHRGGASAHWIYSHKQKLANLEKMLTELDSKKELSDMQKREIEIQQICFDLILKDMELNLDDFSTCHQEPSFVSSFEEEIIDPMEKKLVKTIPGLTITTNIKHL